MFLMVLNPFSLSKTWFKHCIYKIFWKKNYLDSNHFCLSKQFLHLDRQFPLFVPTAINDEIACSIWWKPLALSSFADSPNRIRPLFDYQGLWLVRVYVFLNCRDNNTTILGWRQCLAGRRQFCQSARTLVTMVQRNEKIIPTSWSELLITQCSFAICGCRIPYIILFWY